MNRPIPARRRDAAHPRLRWLAVLATALLTVLPSAALAATGPGPTAPVPAAVAEDDGSGSRSAGLVVEITDLSPAVLTPEDDLTVHGTIANPGDVGLEATELRLRMQYATPISRSALERWLEPDSVSGTYLLAVEDGGAVPAGGTAAFSFTIPAEDLPLPSTQTAWGPRGIEVEATSTTGEEGTDRSFAVWYPDVTMEPTRLSVLVPVTPTAAELAQETDVASASAPRLTALLQAVDRPGVTAAVDPLVLTAPDAATDGDTAARAWSQVLTATTAFTGEVLALPWADPDLAALAHAGRPDLLAAARERAAERTTGLAAEDAVAWPAGGGVDLATVSTAADAGAESVVVPGSQLEPTAALSYTPTGRADVGTGSGTVAALVTDERLSAVLRGRHLPVAAPEDHVPTRLDALTARQLLLADTAVITRERPADPRSLLLTLPRVADRAVDLTALGERLDVLTDAPWVELVPVSRMAQEQAPQISREELPTELRPDAAEVTPRTLATIDGALADAAAFAQVTEDPDAFLAPYERTLGTAVSAAWRTEPSARSAMVERVTAQIAGLDDQVVAEPSSTLNLINDVAHIPVRVSSSLPETAHVQVVLDGPDQRLEATESVAVEVPPGGQATAQVPVHAVGSGTVLVGVGLLTPSGDPVGTPTEITVRIRADWEDVGTGVVAGVLVVLLVVGLVRTARRGRRMQRGEGTA